MKDWDVFAVAGPSGVGKSTVSYALARRLGVAVAEADDLFHAIESVTTPEQQPAIHHWRTRPEARELPSERMLELHLETCRAMSPAIASVINNHIETRLPVVLDGDYILPELIARFPDRVKAVFLYEDDQARILENYLSREPGEGNQLRRAQVSVLFGGWLRDECARHDLAAIPVRPWRTAVERAIAAALA